jgi:hypothetical protein
MTPNEFLKKMREISEKGDQEGSHVDADRLMCKVLEEHGYVGGVKIFKQMPKWYA